MRRISQLDGLRALAVGLVVTDHCLPWFAGGGVGVCIFFVLSGYLISSLLLGELEQAGRLRRGLFYIRRALRLYPALLVLLGVTMVAGRAAIKSALIAATYTTNLFMTLRLDGAAPFDHTWSLALEEQFYWLWPLFLPLFVRAGRRASVIILTVLAIGSAAWAQLGAAAVTDRSGAVTVAVFNPLWQAHGLLIGCALAFLTRHRPVTRAALLTNAGLLACLAIALAASATAGLHWAAGWNLLCEFAAAAAIAGMRDRAIGLGRLLILRPLRWAGARSYAIYLWHYPLIYIAHERGYGESGVLAAAAISVLAAALSWPVVERPFLRVKRRFEPTCPKHAAGPLPAGRHRPAPKLAASAGR